jgi:hypothetical protein
MDLLNSYGDAFRRQRLRVLPVLDKAEVRSRAMRSRERGKFIVRLSCLRTSMLLPLKADPRAAKVDWGYGRIPVRDCADAGWIHYVLNCIIHRVPCTSNADA